MFSSVPLGLRKQSKKKKKTLRGMLTTTHCPFSRLADHARPDVGAGGLWSDSPLPPPPPPAVRWLRVRGGVTHGPTLLLPWTGQARLKILTSLVLRRWIKISTFVWKSITAQRVRPIGFVSRQSETLVWSFVLIYFQFWRKLSQTILDVTTRTY